MRIIRVRLAVAALLLAGCAHTPERVGTGGGIEARPAYYIAPPPPGARRCMVWGEDMYGRRFCDRYYGS